jgi:hypothetical protein
LVFQKESNNPLSQNAHARQYHTTLNHPTPHHTTPHNTTLHYTAYLCNDPRVTGPSEIVPGGEVLLSPVAGVSRKEGKAREKEAERTRRRGRKGVEGRGGGKR